MLTRNMATSEMALMNGNLINYTNYELNNVFTLHGFILNLIPIYSILYLFFSWRLWFTFFSKEKPNSISYPLMKKWGFAFLMFKSIAMFSFFGLRLIRQFSFDYLESSVSIFLSISSIIFSAYIIYNPDILSKISKINVKKRENSALEESKVDEIFKTLALITQNQQLYLEPGLNIANFAAISKISIENIKKVISENGFTSYTDYMNSFRIKRSQDLIKNNYLNLYSISTLAKESGFKSDETFYRVFKKANECTPNEYLKRLKTA